MRIVDETEFKDEVLGENSNLQLILDIGVCYAPIGMI